MVLGTVAFGGVGLFLAGTLKPLVNLAVVNAAVRATAAARRDADPAGQTPPLAGRSRPTASGVCPVRGPARHARPRRAGVDPGLGGAGRLGGRRPAGGRRVTFRWE